jgi:hypothetical protein
MMEVIATFDRSSRGAEEIVGSSFGLCLGVPIGDNISCPVRIEIHQGGSALSESSESSVVINGSSSQQESAFATMGLLNETEAVEVRAFVDQTFAVRSA